MDNKRKSIILTVLASVSAASTAPLAATPQVRPLFIVLPLVLMGILLFFAGYYAGLNKLNR
ncbi:hypothetical protein M1563_00835 [Patescibacteria group bacterium]|nr:hypothetical protein [Patescibacteria group bacterium]MCL5410161.1 hypothetical protein [Patescibacteria group bacterium]